MEKDTKYRLVVHYYYDWAYDFEYEVPVLEHSDKDLMKHILKRLNNGETTIDDYKGYQIK